MTVHHSGGAAATPPARAALPRVCATDTGFATSETSIAATNTGALFFSPAHTENSLARSSDASASWALTYPPTIQYTSLWNTVDPEVTVDKRTGRLFWLRATGELRTAPVLVDQNPFGYQAATAIAYAHGFQVYGTPDDGRTWTTADYQHEETGDWEKIFVGPPTAKGPKPSGYPDVVYVCANAPFEVSGPGRDCYRSLDGGASFTLAGYVFPSASSPSDFCPALAGNTGVVDSAGTTYQPQSCSNGTYVAVSEDEGGSYSWLRITGAPPSSGLFGPAQLAIDDADNLYAMWMAGGGIELVVSRDHAKTWSKPLQVSAPGLRQFDLPAMAAGASGEVGITYYSTTAGSGASKRAGEFDESEESEEHRDPDEADKQADSGATPPPLTAYITQTTNALADDPLFYSAPLNDPGKPIFINYAGNATPRADYIGGTYDRSGTFWAGAVKQMGEPDADKNIATTGRVGRFVFHDRVGLPSSPRCPDRRKFTFKLHHAPHARVTRVVVFVNGKRKLARRGRNLHRITIRRLPRGRFEVKIVATQSSGSTLTSTRVYRGCKKSRPTTRAHHH